MIAIFVGSFVNISIKRYVRDEWVFVHPLAVLGMFDLFPQLRRIHRQTVIAVNLGGCVVPSGLALYELLHISSAGAQVWWAVGIASAVNTVTCYAVARPVAGIGIVMPTFVSPLVAAVAALMLASDQAPPVAFISMQLGILDSLHRGHRIDSRDLRPAAAEIPYDDVTRQHRAYLVFDLQRLMRESRITGAQDAIISTSGMTSPMTMPACARSALGAPPTCCRI